MSRTSPNLRPHDSPRVRYRVRFAKTGLLRWISHRDLARLFERVARRADVPIALTEGFNPTPRMSFCSALPLGVESLDEVVDIELTRELRCEDLLSRLRDDQQPGLTIGGVTRVEIADGKAQLAATEHHVTLPDNWDESDRDALNDRIADLLAQTTLRVTRGDKNVTANVTQDIPALILRRDHLFIRMIHGDDASLRVHDLLDLLQLDDWLARGSTIVRTKVDLRGPRPKPTAAPTTEHTHRPASMP